MTRWWQQKIVRQVGIVLGTVLSGCLLTSSVFASDSPSGFYYGADGFNPTFNGTSVPYTEPVTGGGVVDRMPAKCGPGSIGKVVQRHVL